MKTKRNNRKEINNKHLRERKKESERKSVTGGLGRMKVLNKNTEEQ